MPERPLLLLKSPEKVTKPKSRGFGATLRTPDRDSQGRRLDPQFTVLDRTFQNKSVVLADNPGCEPPELILVIETVGAVQNFFRAVSLIPELKWQFEYDDDLEPDGEFFNADSPKKKLNGFAYLMLCNQQAMGQLESLWKHWKKTGEVPYGFGPWKEAFRLLKTIRRWNEEDRIRGTGLEEYAQELQARGEIAACELELWFRDKPADRDAAERRIRHHVTQAGGQVVSSFAHAGIRYHGLLIQIPSRSVQSYDTEQSLDVRVIASELAKGFDRPVRYGVAVSIEVGEGIAILVYDEIAERIRLQVRSSAHY